MSAIAHHLESAGIATTLIGLIRLHVETSRPPRALWVPFQLGRPVGAPLDAAFQRRVILAALSLLDKDASVPILEDFPDDEPGAADRRDWRAPFGFPEPTLDAEVAALKPFYERAAQKTGRTTFGVSGLTIDAVVDYLLAVDSATPPPNPRKDLADVQMLRYAVDDLKVYYLEALVEADPSPSGWQAANWFWEQTRAGELVKVLRLNSIDHPDSQRRFAAWWLVPDGWSDAQTVARMRTIKVQ